MGTDAFGIDLSDRARQPLPAAGAPVRRKDFSLVPALGQRIRCIACNVTRRVEASHSLCDHCARDADAIRKIVALILQKFPKMDVYSTPELILRLWMAFPPVQKDAEAVAAAQALSDTIVGRLISEPPKPEDPEAHEELQNKRVSEVNRRNAQGKRKA